MHLCLSPLGCGWNVTSLSKLLPLWLPCTHGNLELWTAVHLWFLKSFFVGLFYHSCRNWARSIALQDTQPPLSYDHLIFTFPFSKHRYTIFLFLLPSVFTDVLSFIMCFRLSNLPPVYLYKYHCILWWPWTWCHPSAAQEDYVFLFTLQQN